MVGHRIRSWAPPLVGATDYILQTLLHKHDKDRDSREESDGMTSKPAKNPAGVGLTNLQGFVLAGVGFRDRRN